MVGRCLFVPHDRIGRKPDLQRRVLTATAVERLVYPRRSRIGGLLRDSPGGSWLAGAD
jgi:hypothetical protein